MSRGSSNTRNSTIRFLLGVRFAILIDTFLFPPQIDMARGNWQRRVERTEARRNESKQRKQRTEEKRIYKTMVQELLALLEAQGDAIRQQAREKRFVIHIWTDSLPSDAPPILDMCCDNAIGKSSSKQQRRIRSGSIEQEEKVLSNKGRSRSNSIHDTPPTSKKKVHPRSKESNTPEPVVEEATFAPRLCRHHFFNGKCEGLRKEKKGGCPHVHYSKRYKTLADVVTGTKTNQLEELSFSKTAFPSVQLEDLAMIDPDAMEMVFYFSIDITPPEMEGSRAINDLVVEALSSKTCTMASVVFLAINDSLVFDRYREGLLVSDKDFLAYATGENNKARPRGQSISSEEQIEDLVSLPGSLLEYILTFLPDAAVASTCLVCRAWNKEIGKVSGFLWRHLLERREWPIPQIDFSDNHVDGSKKHVELLAFRDAFISHYSALRDCRALQTGLIGLASRKSVEEKELCYRSFHALRGAPQEPNSCISVEVWSPNRILAAYSHDCTIRLFNAVSKAGHLGEKTCKELVCQSLDPYKNTKKRTCRLVAIGLDDEVIGGLCHVMEDNQSKEAFILTLLSREDFLVGVDDDDDEPLQVIDIGESVLNFLLSYEDADHGLLRLHDFLSEDGDLEEIEVLVSQSLSACGYGRLMVEVSVSLPDVEVNGDDDDSGANMNILFRKLFMFSSSLGAIVWMGDSNPLTHPLRPRHEDMTLAAISVKPDERSRLSCNLVSVSSTSPCILSVSIGPTGEISIPLSKTASEIVRNEILQDGWTLRSNYHRPVVVTPSEIVVADTLMQEMENGDKQFKSVISFYPHFSNDSGLLYRTICIKGNVQVDRIVRLRSQHVIALCRCYSEFSQPVEIDDIDGQWFGGIERGPVSVYAIIIHLPSRQEVDRLCLVKDLKSQLGTEPAEMRHLPILLAFDGETAAAGIWWKGVVMTGQDIRRVGERNDNAEIDQIPIKAKKKKSKTPKKGSKKDGFARGMSMRG